MKNYNYAIVVIVGMAKTTLSLYIVLRVHDFQKSPSIAHYVSYFYVVSLFFIQK